MPLSVKYGAYTFPTGTTIPSVSKSWEVDDQGRRTLLRQSWRIRTQLLADGESDISSAITAFEAALDTDGKDLTIYESGGSATPHTIISADTVSGTKVSGLDYPDATGVEYAIQRTAEVTISATFRLEGDDTIVAFQESLSLSGGGPRRKYRELISGRPKGPYQLAEHTLYRAQQSGSAEATDTYPQPSSPLFPGFESEPPEYSLELVNGEDGERRYRITWSYRFESAYELVGVPNEWLL